MKPYYNTTSLEGEELKAAVASATRQEEAVFQIFRNCKRGFTASEITRLTEKAGKRYPIWSNRRAITNLMQQGLLIKTDQKQMNPDTGKPEHKYILCPRYEINKMLRA